MENKEVYTWTINGEEDLTKYLQTNVDGIITDDPALADQIKEEKKDETYFDRSIRILFEYITKTSKVIKMIPSEVFLTLSPMG